MVLKCSPEQNIAYSEISHELQDTSNYKLKIISSLYFQNRAKKQKCKTTNLLGNDISKWTETICVFRSNLLALADKKKSHIYFSVFKPKFLISAI